MQLGNSAEAYVGTHKISHHTAIYWGEGSRAMVESEAQRLVNAHPETFVGALGSASCRVACERDKADTNGQLALIAAFNAGTTVQLVVYPEGNTTGNEKWTVTAYVIDCGETTFKNGALPMLEFKFSISGDVTKGVVS
jgi:hypothetical protein